MNSRSRQIKIMKVEELVKKDVRDRDNLLNKPSESTNNNNTNYKMYYNKEKEEEFENKNLFAYEMYENIDYPSDNEGKEKYSKPSIISSSKLMSKKTTSRSNPKSTLTRKENENLQTGSNEILIKENIKTSYEIREDEIQQLVSADLREEVINTEQRSRSCSTNFRVKKVSSSKVSHNVSYGERLYFKTQAMKEQNGIKLKNMKKDNLAKEMKECTFKPQLCGKSILFNLKSVYNSEDLFEMKSGVLPTQTNNTDKYSRGSKIVMKNSNTYNNLLAKNKRNLRDNPDGESVDLNKIANRSKNNFYIKDTHEHRTHDTTKTRKTKTEEELIQHGQKLYYEAERLRVEKENLTKQHFSENCPFRPKINDSSPPNVYNFFFRLQKWVDRRNEKYEYDLEKVNYDEKTGKRLFSPQVLQRFNRQNESQVQKNKFIDLYDEWKKRELKNQHLQEQKEQKKLILANISHTTNKSREITQENTKKIFAKVYENLVDQINNVINGSNIDLTKLPDKVVDVLMPLVNELKEQNETLTFDEFILAGLHLYNAVPFEQKQILLNWYSNSKVKTPTVNDALTFKPMINKKSEKIVSSSPKFASNFYNRAIEFLRNKEEKIKTEVDKKVKNSVSEECTFRPKLISKNRSDQSSYYTKESSNQENFYIRGNLPLETYDIKETYEENNTTD